MKTTLRRLLAGVVLTGASLVTIPFTAGVGADERPGFAVAPGQTVQKAYAPLIGADPATPEADGYVSPESCRTLPSCGLVPLTLAYPPGFDKTGDYFIRIEVGFESTQINGPAGVETGSNDIDVYIWERPKKIDPKTKAVTYTRRAATSSQPEKTAVDRPQGTVLDVVVNNFNGRNTGFTVKAKFETGEVSSPFESTEPGRPSGGGSSASSSTDFKPPVDLSDVPDAPMPSAIGGGADIPSGDLGPQLLDVGDDTDLSGLGVGGLDSSESGSDAIFTAAQREQDTGPLPEPSTIALLLGLVVAPIAIAVGGAAWFVRRRPAALMAG